MATSANITPKYQYLRSHSVNQVLIERILLPGLANQGKFAGASRGIELPAEEGQTAQFLPLSEAAILVISWLESHRNLETSESKRLESIATNMANNKDSFSTLTTILHNAYYERVAAPETNFTTTVRTNVEAYRASQQQDQYASVGYNPGNIIDSYNKTYQEVNKLFLSGAPKSAIASLLPIDRNSKTPIATQKVLASIIAANLDRFTSARDLHLGKSSDTASLQAHSVTQELEKIIKSGYRDNTDLLNFTGDSDFQKGFLQTINSTANAYVGGDGKLDRLDKYRKERLAAAQALPLVVPSILEIESSLLTIFTNAKISSSESRSLTSTILKEINRSALKSPDATSIVNSALNRLNVDQNHRQLITNALNTPQFKLAVSYHAQKLASSTITHEPNRYDRRLIKSGVNPQHTLFTSQELRNRIQTLLPPQPLPESNFDLEQLVYQKYLQERGSGSQSSLANTLKDWLDSAHTTFRLDPSGEKLASRSRLEHSFTNSFSRQRHAGYQLQNKLYKIEQNLPWNKGLKKLASAYDKIAESAVVPLPFTKGKVKIPLFRIVPWAVNGWHNYKKATAIRWLKGLRGTKSGVRKFAQFNLRHYLKGGVSFGGMFNSASREVWSKRIAKPMAKWANKRFQSGVFKYATKSVGRTGTRFLLRVGGKALARFGSKAVLALASFAGAVTTVIGAISVVAIVVDLVVLVKDFAKEFIKNADFRGKALKFGAFIGGLVSLTWLAPLGVFLAGVAGLMLQTLLLAGGVALGLLAFFTIFFNIFTKLPMDIDSAPGQLLASIICDKSDGGTGNPTAEAAICIAQVLNECGLNPLKKGNTGGTGWKCALASFLADQTMQELKYSADAYGGLQCVGLIAAANVESTGTDSSFSHAKLLGEIVPKGYRFAAGAGSCKTGDFFVDTGGAWGHTGVVINPDAGAFITCVDANAVGSGVIRDEKTCRYPKGKIAGCLKKL